MRVPFDLIFNRLDERIIPKTPVTIGHLTFAAGVSLSPTLMFLGTDLERLVNCDLVVEDEDGIVEVIGYFRAEIISMSPQ